jgi:hypothetical protein
MPSLPATDAAPRSSSFADLPENPGLELLTVSELEIHRLCFPPSVPPEGTRATRPTAWAMRCGCASSALCARPMRPSST